MAINVTLNEIRAGNNLSILNDNFVRIEAALQDAVSRSGTVPNNMGADLDLNSNNLLNVNSLAAQAITVNGINLTDQLTATLDAAAAAAASELAAATSATDSANSATASAASASASSTSATNSANSATASATSASAAATSATNAATSSTQASTSASNAATSATNASSSATDAANSAAAALVSEGNASTSETNAATSASDSSTYATNSSNSATASATSASQAATSATNASTSETNAAGHEAQALVYANAAQAASENLAYGYTFDTGTADADPGVGKFRFNNATFGSATFLYINETSDEGSLADVMDIWDDSSSTIKATIRIRDPLDTSDWFELQITGSIVDAGTYRKIPIQPVATNGTVANNTPVLLGVVRHGDAGTGAVDSFNSRTGSVLPVASDYDASQVDNDSGVSGAYVSDALNTLNSGKAAASHTHPISDVTNLQSTLDSKLVATNNLSDLTVTATARANLGLGNVDNTSDVNKPVSTAQQAALNLKANLTGANFTGRVYSETSSDYPLHGAISGTARFGNIIRVETSGDGSQYGPKINFYKVNSKTWSIGIKDGTSEGTNLVWLEGAHEGSAGTQTLMLSTTGQMWSASYGWYHDYFALKSELPNTTELERVVKNKVQTFFNTPTTYGPSTDGQILGLSTTINNVAASSKVQIDLTISHEIANNGVFYIRRNGAEIGSGVASGNRKTGIIPIPYEGNTGSSLASVSFSYLDESPGTGTNTYTVHWRSQGTNTMYLNRTQNDANDTETERGASFMILTEVMV